jgi:hypothetical protein
MQLRGLYTVEGIKTVHGTTFTPLKRLSESFFVGVAITVSTYHNFD